MKQLISISFLVLVVLFFSSCASIVSKSSYPVTFSTSPTDAEISILDRKGEVVYKGSTPVTVELGAGAGFFKKAVYQVNLKKKGFEPKVVSLKAKVDGWYFGNLIGIVGFLVLDPSTGAMYKIKEEIVTEQLISLDANAGSTINVLDINEIPDYFKEHLVKIEE